MNSIKERWSNKQFRWAFIFSLIIGIVLCLLLSYIFRANATQTSPSHVTDPRAIAVKPTAATVTIPAVVVRAGHNGVVQPTQWCLDNQGLCKDKLTDLFRAAMADNPTNKPTAHAEANMKRVWLNEYNAAIAKNPASKLATAACGPLCAYNHFHDDLVSNPSCQLKFKWGNETGDGKPVWPDCGQIMWGGDSGKVDGHDIDVIDAGWLVCENTFLGTAVGTEVFTAGASTPLSVGIAAGGTFGCAVGWVTGKFVLKPFL